MDMHNDDSATHLGGQYVTFRLGEEEYGVSVDHVQEILGYKGFTRIPRTAPFVKGILNLRGTVVPVIDLRTMLGLQQRTYDKYTVIIIVEVSGRIMGMVVDAVSDVPTFSAADVRAAPTLSASIRADYILGMTTRLLSPDDEGQERRGFTILLDIDRILSPEELEAVDEAL